MSKTYLTLKPEHVSYFKEMSSLLISRIMFYMPLVLHQGHHTVVAITVH